MGTNQVMPRPQAANSTGRKSFIMFLKQHAAWRAAVKNGAEKACNDWIEAEHKRRDERRAKEEAQIQERREMGSDDTQGNKQRRSERVEQMLQRLANEDHRITTNLAAPIAMPHRLSRTAWINSKLRIGWTIEQCITARREILERQQDNPTAIIDNGF